MSRIKYELLDNQNWLSIISDKEQNITLHPKCTIYIADWYIVCSDTTYICYHAKQNICLSVNNLLLSKNGKFTHKSLQKCFQIIQEDLQIKHNINYLTVCFDKSKCFSINVPNKEFVIPANQNFKIHNSSKTQIEFFSFPYCAILSTNDVKIYQHDQLCFKFYRTYLVFIYHNSLFKYVIRDNKYVLHKMFHYNFMRNVSAKLKDSLLKIGVNETEKFFTKDFLQNLVNNVKWLTLKI